MLSEEFDKGCLGFESEGVVAEVDGFEIGEGKERGEKGGKGRGGISERRREVKMSARFMDLRDVWEERRGARWVQAGAPRVLPEREMCVNVIIVERS